MTNDSRQKILLKFYTHVLDESADMAAETVSGQLNTLAGQAVDGGRRERP